MKGTVIQAVDHFSQSTDNYLQHQGGYEAAALLRQVKPGKTTPGCHQGHPTHDPTSASLSWRRPQTRQRNAKTSGKENKIKETCSEMITGGKSFKNMQKEQSNDQLKWYEKEEKVECKIEKTGKIMPLLYTTISTRWCCNARRTLILHSLMQKSYSHHCSRMKCHLKIGINTQEVDKKNMAKNINSEAKTKSHPQLQKQPTGSVSAP